MILLDGKALAAEIEGELRERIAQRGIQPGLAVIRVGDDPASAIYVGGKERACGRVGFYSHIQAMPESTSEAELLAEIERLNQRPDIHGILVQMPLPAHIRSDVVIAAIAPHKDVDGFHPLNVGALTSGAPGLVSCTPLGIMRLLQKYNLPVAGKHAVVVGRSNIVGKPMALLLLQANATVTIAHSRTPDLGAITRQADILVAAVGKAGLIQADMVKPGAVVIDVGMNRNEGKLCGDVNFAAVAEQAGYITPVPGGVGPMTIAMLLANTLQAAEASS